MLEHFEKNEGAKEKICGFGGIYHSYGWDFEAVFNEGQHIIFRPGENGNMESISYPSNQCLETFKLNGACYNKFEINYYLWGYVNRLCGNSRTVALLTADTWAQYKDWKIGENTLTQCKLAFAAAGYEGMTGLASIPSYCSYKKCKLNVPTYESKDLEPCLRGYNAEECK